MRTLLHKSLSVLAIGIGISGVQAQDRIVQIDGSSTVYPVTEAVAEEFQIANVGVKATVGISGTGGGFKKFCRGEIDIADASRPIQKEEIEECRKNGIEFIELPICFDALTVVINPQNTWAKTMTVAELKKVWEPVAQGKITKWNQIRPDWPDAKIELFGPGTDSGTFDYFTEAVVGKSKSSRGDYTASEDDNVLVRGVEGSKNSLGYFGFAYYAPHARKLTAVAIDSGKGPVLPSKDTVISGAYNPLSRPLFIYVNKKSLIAKPHVKSFVEFYLGHVPDLSEEVKYVPLPSEVYASIKDRFEKAETGTAFGGGHSAGLSIEDIVNRPLAK